MVIAPASWVAYRVMQNVSPVHKLWKTGGKRGVWTEHLASDHSSACWANPQKCMVKPITSHTGVPTVQAGRHTWSGEAGVREAE